MEKPEAENQGESLISSSSLPEFEDIEKEYQAYMANLTPDEPVSAQAPKKRGRKPKTEAIDITGNEEISEDITPDQLENIVCFPLDSWFVRNDKKRLSNIERKAFAESCSRLANKWLPKITSQWKEEMGFCICVGTIFMTRMNVEKPEDKKANETKTETEETKV